MPVIAWPVLLWLWIFTVYVSVQHGGVYTLCVHCLSYLVEAHTAEAGDPGEGGVASSFSSNEQGRYTSVPLPGLDTHTNTHIWIYSVCTHMQRHQPTGRILTTAGKRTI